MNKNNITCYDENFCECRDCCECCFNDEENEDVEKDIQSLIEEMHKWDNFKRLFLERIKI